MEYLSMGVEFGSTRIKSVLIDKKGKVVSIGETNWENSLVNGLWSYSKDEILSGLASCVDDLFNKLNNRDIKIASLGISAMMHGYIALDKNDNLLVPFRTWRNTNTSQASSILSELFMFNIPERWSIAHLYQAILNNEEHIKDIAYITTLSGYIHYLLTGEKLIGIDDASGMFPINDETKEYDLVMVEKFNKILKENNLPYSLLDILPKVKLAGEEAGCINKKGVALFNPNPYIVEGIKMCPPEGDAGTGMVATTTILPKTGNISVGTSVFLMMVLNKSLKKYYKEIDMVTTPDGLPVAMVHANNCSSEINNWMGLFEEAFKVCGANISTGELYSKLFANSLNSNEGTSNLIYYNFSSGEPIFNVTKGQPTLVCLNNEKLNLANFIKSQIYSSMCSISVGMELLRKENIEADYIFGHGGLFKSADVVTPIVASLLSSKVAITNTSSEGGPYGMALLALYMLNNEVSLNEFLQSLNVIGDLKIYEPSETITKDFANYLKNYKEYLHLANGSITNYSYADIKKRVYDANILLYKSGLAPLTWGNVSEIDRVNKIIAIKPSGVSYETMRPDDIVITDLDGNVIEGNLRPSSDLKTHVVLYKEFKNIGAVVHTHSPYATSFAQANKSIDIYGTTHADSFYGNIPCARSLTKEEIEEDYEKNTGVIIAKEFENKDYEAIPGVIVANHGPFTWGKNAKKAVENAIVLEKVAQMNFQTLLINQNAALLEKHIMDKHYYRKHGKNAYYGQGEK